MVVTWWLLCAVAVMGQWQRWVSVRRAVLHSAEVYSFFLCNNSQILFFHPFGLRCHFNLDKHIFLSPILKDSLDEWWFYPGLRCSTGILVHSGILFKHQCVFSNHSNDRKAVKQNMYNANIQYEYKNYNGILMSEELSLWNSNLWTSSSQTCILWFK